MEKYKLPLRLISLVLLMVSSVVWVRGTAVPIQTAVSQLPGTTKANVEIKGAFQGGYGEGFRKTAVKKVIELPKFNYVRSLIENYKLSVDLDISSAEELEKGAYWCGAPFFFSYQGSARVRILNEFGKVEDEIGLTPPTLVIGRPPNYDYYYYKTYDLDGDKNNLEFIILDYDSCNGNWAKIVRVDVETHKFVMFPLLIGGRQQYKILTGPNKGDLIFSRGRITTKTYDMVSGLFNSKEFTYKNDMFVEFSKP